MCLMFFLNLQILRIALYAWHETKTNSDVYASIQIFQYQTKYIIVLSSPNGFVDGSVEIYRHNIMPENLNLALN